jgi:hypothetical protein
VTEPQSPLEAEELWKGKPVKGWRFSKFYLNTLFDGAPHLVQRGIDFPPLVSDETVTAKLRSAAWWRKTTLHIVRCPEGLWVQSPDNVSGMSGTVEYREQLAKALAENAELKEELWKLKTGL